MFKSNKGTDKKFSIFKILSLIVLFTLLGFTSNIFVNSNYDKITSKFYSAFNKNDYSNAKSLLENKTLLISKNKLNEDLETYFTDVVNKVCIALSNNEINNTTALEILNEIDSYDILGSSLNKLISALENPKNTAVASTNSSEIGSNELTSNTQNENSYLNLGILAFNSKDYNKAIDYFNLVSKDTPKDYEIAQDYINDFYSNYKSYLLDSVEELVANKYYTKALGILSNYDASKLSKDDIVEINNKINSVTQFREEYQGEDSEYTSNAILQEITPNNINTLAIDSKTPYLIYLNLSNQMTYVYEGEKNNWTLLKEFSSSTGIEGEETPKGIFSVTDRGEWFYSHDYEQGGKYWVQFMGDYLFHSLPYNEDQSEIVDYTLGEPASHGCIRLKVEDSKWIYDNIDNDTKVIIN
ncbi:L,D-transpeptidase family protein [Clostridium tertium]|uniref:L,D-transpeptidase YciB n=1 Tax=Clostridium tertium TaxID=1559 RepID=A0A6N3CDE3_9CLOT